MKIALVFLALCAATYALPVANLSKLPQLDEGTTQMLQSLLNDPEAMKVLQANPQLQQAFQDALSGLTSTDASPDNDRCLYLLTWLLLLSQISSTTTSG